MYKKLNLIIILLLLVDTPTPIDQAQATEEQVLTTAFCCGAPRAFSLFHLDSLISIHTAVIGSLYSFYYPSGREPIPVLADGPPILSADNKTYTVHLREGLKFSNGAELTAADVMFSYNAYLSSEINANPDFLTYNSLSKLFASNASIQAVDPQTLQFTFIEPAIHNLRGLTVPIVEKNRYVNRFNSCVDGVVADCDWATFDGEFVHSAGPYKVDTLLHDEFGNISGVEYIRNEYYQLDETSAPLDQTYADRIKVYFAFNDSLAESLVSNNDIDLYYSNFYFPIFPSDYVITREISSDTMDLYTNFQHPFIGTGSAIPDGPNATTTNELIKSKLVRQAMLHAINRTAMLFPYEDQFHASAFVSPTYIQESAFKDTTPMDPYSFNVTEARRLMEAAGFDYSTITDANNDGDYGDVGDTTFFNLTLIYPSDRQGPRLNASLIIKDNLPKIGIGITLNQDYTFVEIGLRTFWRNYSGSNVTLPPVFDEGGFDLSVLGYFEDPQFFTFFNRLTQDGLCSADSGYTCSNFQNYNNPVLDNLIAQYENSLDFDERATILKQIEGMVYDDIPITPLISFAVYFVHKPEVKGFDLIMLNLKYIEWRELYKEGWRRGPASESSKGIPTLNHVAFSAAAGVLILATVFLFSRKNRA